MTLIPALFAFIAFYIFALLTDQLKVNPRRQVLALTCVALTLMVGTRDIYAWSDTLIYFVSFRDTPSLFNLMPDSHPYGYSEMGFYYIGTIVKLFTSDPTIYFTIISAITFFFLYKSFDKYSIYPMFGVAVYLARFYTGRNMTQIRSALAIAIVIYFTFLLFKRKWWKYFFVVVFAYFFHKSAMIAIPLLLLRDYKIKSNYIYIGIVISLIIGGAFGDTVKSWVQANEFMMEQGGSYLQEGSEKAFSNTIANPVIWYQIFILFAYTFYENKLKDLSPYYYIMRNGYFYCTCILIIMCQYAIVAARTSTIFATFEIAMVPMLINMWGKKERIWLYIIFGVAYIVLFYMNWSPHYH